MLTLKLIREAAARIDGRVHRTPVMTSRSFNDVAGCEVFFKCENLQRAGAFKARGATNKILSLRDDEKKRGVLAVSAGNHAQAVALAARAAAVKGVKPSIRCFAVEPDTANDTQQSFEKGERVKISPPPTIADGLRVQTPGELTFPITRQNTEAVLTVTDEEIIETMRFMLFRM